MSALLHMLHKGLGADRLRWHRSKGAEMAITETKFLVPRPDAGSFAEAVADLMTAGLDSGSEETP